MLEIDLHSHSLYSHCGVHSVLEMLTYAKLRGLKALAITDHGPIIKGCRLNNPFFFRLKDPVPGIKLLKGAELNVVNDNGKTDLPLNLLAGMDIVLLGLHQNVETKQGKKKYTDLFINAIKNNSFIDIITHPNDLKYLPDFNLLVEACLEYDVVVEINNSKTELKLIDDEITLDLINTCKKNNCRIAVNSDAHVIHEIGNDMAVRPLLKKANFPEELIINSTYESAMDFIEKRRVNKTSKKDNFAN